MNHFQRTSARALWLLWLLPACSGGGGETTTTPVLTGLTVEADGTFTVTGTNLERPFEVVFLDASGDPIAEPVPVDTVGDGASATGVTPEIPAPLSRVTVQVRIGGATDSPAIEAEIEVPCRTIDGTGNNALDPLAGSAGIELARMVPADYADGFSALAGADRPNARAISNAAMAQAESVTNARGASDMLWQWGQFLDHDIGLTPEADPAEGADIAVPSGDADFDPAGTGEVVLHFSRSAYRTGSAPRQQLNAITAFIDASNVYGSDDERAAALRANDGTGRLRTSAGAMLPFNETGLPNAGGPSAELFVAGDVRANEQIGLTAMHTLFVREHNRLADEIRARNPELSGDDVYQSARRIVGAQMQVITYREFLPLMLGSDALRPYEGYDESVDPSLANLFSTGAYRFGHSLLSSQVLRLDASGREIAEGHLALREAFFNPTRLIDEGGIEPVLRGLAAQECQALDLLVIDDVRSFLFGAPGAGGLDLAALNIQRGRDHGLPSYNAVRRALGLAAATSIADISADPAVQARLADAYATVEQIDVWVGGLAEDHLPGAMMGELFRTVMRDQFERLRDGDRFWYQRVFSGRELQELERTRLSDIIRRNTTIGTELPGDVFRVGTATAPVSPPAPPADPVEAERRRRMEDRFGGPRN